MKRLGKVILVSLLATGWGLGCGDGSGANPDTNLVIKKEDAGMLPDKANPVPDTGIEVPPDSAIAPGVDVKPTSDLVAASGCEGLTAEQCHFSIINAAVEATVNEQVVPPPIPPDYLSCIAM